MVGSAAKAGWRPVLVALCGLALRCGDVAAGTLASPGCLDGGTPAVVTALEPPFDILVADGRHLRLAGLDPGPGDTADATRDRLASWLVGRAVRVAPFGTAPDRWGRTPALVFAADASGVADRSVSVAEALLEAGLARARPETAPTSCWAAYLELEGGARAARRGLWADPSAVIAATDEAALRSRLGAFAVVEGTVGSLREGRARTYLRFAETPAGGFAVSLDRPTLSRFGKAGLTPSAWLGRPVRVRGVLDDRWGLQIEIARPEQIEVVTP